MVGIISVTKKGDYIADIISKYFQAEAYKKSEDTEFSLDKVTRLAFKKYKSIIFISSTGIAVRGISKYLNSKEEDPAVVVVDVCNNFTISLLSGHLGGANKLTLELARILNNTPVITTATDNLGIEAPDVLALKNNLQIENLNKAKMIASRLVNGQHVYYKDDKNKINCPRGYIRTEAIKDYTLWITNKNYKFDKVLKLIRKDIIIGIGCKRNIEFLKLKNFLFTTLEENNIAIEAIDTIASIDIKSDEKAILMLRKFLKCKLKFFSKEDILTVENKFEGSDFVKRKVGVKAVSEPVVELAGGKIIVNKVKSEGITLTIGEV